ncbi:MAG: sigma-70 family RNA polymerase sigma factor [Sedimentisphaerales bacterium]|nr:sigma-70 family RNA polymerase sigma factor [Sedimentisphaerales bacterium]
MKEDVDSDAELIRRYAETADHEAFAEIYRRYAGMVYSICFRKLGNHADAQDAALACFLILSKKPSGATSARSVASWLGWCAVGVARNAWKIRTRREQREREVWNMPTTDESSDRMRDVFASIEDALALLPERLREALILSYYRGMTQKQIAEELGCPEGTIASRVSQALDMLRRRVRTRAGGLSSSQLAETLGSPALLVPVPAALLAHVQAMLSGQPVSGAVAELAQATWKGLFWAKVKAIAAMAAGVAVIGGGAAIAVAQVAGGGADKKADAPGKTEESAAASRFPTPATDPGAEWEDKGPWAGIGYGHGKNGYLDGPRLEAMFYSAPGGPGAIFAEDGAVNAFRTYDPKTDRYMTIVGCGARGGGIDGPFSRVRLGGWGYSSSGGMAGGRSSRYIYYTSTLAGQSTLRRLDFEKRVSEVAPGNVEVTGREIYVYEDGYFVRQNTSLRKYAHDGKLVKEYTLEPGPRESLGPYDPKNDRIYGSSREGSGASAETSWVVWGWDLKADGKFFGVIPASRNPACKPLRKQCATGPFKGSFFYCPGGLGFGPGDPAGRYLYMGGGDEANMYRLDLEKQEWIKLVRTADGKRWRFGDAPGSVQAWNAGGGVKWAADGSENMYPGYRGWNRLYERVK